MSEKIDIIYGESADIQVVVRLTVQALLREMVIKRIKIDASWVLIPTSFSIYGLITESGFKAPKVTK